MSATQRSLTLEATTTPSKGRGQQRLRSVAMVVHRYTGLLIAVFLLVAGLTGSLLVFNEELDGALNSKLFYVAPPTPDARMLDPFTLQQRIQAILPAGQQHNEVLFDQKPGRSVSAWLDLGDDTWRQVFVDPYTGRALGSREWGNLSEGSTNLMPFVYRLHYSLALGEVGMLLFGLAALLWTVDCFVGAYLTFPAPERKQGGSGGRSWFARWRRAWMVRANQLFGFVFTFHRASGLWVWAMLLVFAWSAVALNLSAVYRPVMSATLGMSPDLDQIIPHLKPPHPAPPLALREAHTLGRRLMREEARRRKFAVLREESIAFASEHGVFTYRVASNLDISMKWPRTQVHFDGRSGKVVAFEAPTGLRTGDTVTSWLYALHFAAVWGIPYRVFVSIMGLSIAGLSVTGVWIWWRKREKRIASKSRTIPFDQLASAPLRGDGWLLRFTRAVRARMRMS